jgi:hypothetical protein
MFLNVRCTGKSPSTRSTTDLIAFPTFPQPIDELYARDFSLIYTTDPNMATHKGEDKMPVQVLQHSSHSLQMLYGTYCYALS